MRHLHFFDGERQQSARITSDRMFIFMYLINFMAKFDCFKDDKLFKT